VQTCERNIRSVHREYCRPQGKRASPKQFSLVKKNNADDDGVNVSEVKTEESRNGEIPDGLSWL